MNRKTRKQEEVLDHGATRPQRQEVRVRQGTLPATFGHWTIMIGGCCCWGWGESQQQVWCCWSGERK